MFPHLGWNGTERGGRGQLLLTSLEVRAKWASLTEEEWLAQMETRKVGSLG